jgi:hypothetical protein
MVIKCVRARTCGKYITLIKAGTISKFRIFFQKLSEFRQLTKTEDEYIYIYKYSFLFGLRLFVLSNNAHVLYCIIQKGVRIYPSTVSVPYRTVFREGPFWSTAQRTVLF